MYRCVRRIGTDTLPGDTGHLTCHIILFSLEIISKWVKFQFSFVRQAVCRVACYMAPLLNTQ